jgi:TolB-like protein
MSRALALALGLLVLGAAALVYVHAAHAPSAATSATASVGVQPFLDLTSGMGEEVLVDDLTERVADRLSQTPGLRTTSARTVFALKGKGFTPAQAAHALGVGYVVDGSVHGEAPRFRVTIRLTQAASGFVVWTRVYERDVAGIAALQDVVAPDVVAALHAAAAK